MTTDTPTVVDRATWLDARRELLDAEKALTRQRDELAALRRRQPWVRVDTDYTFDTPDGPRHLTDLTGTRAAPAARSGPTATTA
jgi:predicted dithiol-disulfide oxidoreductase (DUF899 family)